MHLQSVVPAGAHGPSCCRGMLIAERHEAVQSCLARPATALSGKLGSCRQAGSGPAWHTGHHSGPYMRERHLGIRKSEHGPPTQLQPRASRAGLLEGASCIRPGVTAQAD